MPTPPPMPRGGEAFGAWWDEEAAQAAADFFPRYLRHTEAEWAGQPFHLASWQAERIIRPVFGWKRANGTRLIRVVWIEVPRKNGKTELAAGISLLALLGDAEFGGQVYSMAVDKKQAAIVFGKAGTMVSLSPELRAHLETFKTSIYCPQLNASFKPLSKGAEGKHGFSPTCGIGDEVHEWPNGDLAQVVHDGTAARRQPLEIYITTAGVAGQGYAWEMHELALQIAAGEVIDPTMHVVLYAMPEGLDWRTEDAWRAANPNYGISVKPDYMRAEVDKAARTPRAENNFKRYHLNIWTEQTTRWLPMDDPGWKGCTAYPRDASAWRRLRDRFRGRRCFGGLDLSLTRDLSSLAWLFPPETSADRWTFLWRFWLPEATVEDQPHPRRVRYRSFEEAGALEITSGNIVDYSFIERAILEDAEYFTPAWLGIDRANASQLALDLKDQHGLPVEFFGQGFLSMSPPSKGFERLVLGNQIEHGNNPVATWMARNAAVERDAADNIKPTKKAAADKIDGIVAAIMALGGTMAGPRKTVTLPYTAERGLLVLG